MILSATANVTFGRKLNEKHTEQPISCKQLTWWTEGGKLQRLLGRATGVQQEVRV